MSKFKQKLIKGLSTFLLAGAFLFPKQTQAQERLIIDNFSQPNDTTLNYCGSADINKDNTITWQDASRLDSLINGTFIDTFDDRLKDRADINGDEQVTIEDKQTLENYLNQNINYLPSNWNKSNTAEKTSWFEKMVEIDKTDSVGGPLCYEFAVPLTINFHGFKSLENVKPENSIWKFSKNNRFNIPVYTVSTRTTPNNIPHAINGVLIGDNPFNFNDWYFLEPILDTRVYPGDISMAKNNNVEINYTWDIDSISGAGSVSKIINWFVDSNENPILQETLYEPFIVPSNPNKDTIPSNVNLS
ncbi:MAG: hypothetical protein HQ543_06120, partial [Bacteroidetes bacterium]|nr:hypothetical protein [Bacteroidota bacterium]